MSEKNVQVIATCVAASKNAICVTLGKPGEGRTEFWIPSSQVHDNSEVYQKGDTGKLIMSRWIAQQKNIENQCDDYEVDDD